MRHEWKESEKLALSLFAKALVGQGIPPIYAIEITDSPDALFIVKNVPVAIECRYLAHPELLKFLGRRNLEHDKAYEVVVPREPHMWVREAIREKAKHIPKYLENSPAKEAWLLLHSSKNHKILCSDRPEESDFFQLLRLGAYLEPHGFSSIWFAELGEAPYRAIEIFGPRLTRPKIEVDEYLSKFPSYPVDKFWFSSVTVAEAKSGEKTASVNLNQCASDPVCLQPLDTRYKIDYSEYIANPNRNSNLTGRRWEFYDERPRY